MTFQTRTNALIESIANVIVGLGISITVVMIIFPALGYQVQFSEATWISGLFTVISIVRSYTLRRFFEW